MTNPASVGLSIGVVKDGIIVIHNFGEVEKNTHRLPTKSTLYAIASVTKTFTASLLAQAVSEKRVRLEDDVRMYLDGDYPNLEFNGEPIRLLHLLNHNSGLPFSLLEDTKSPRLSIRTDFYDALHRIRISSAPGSKFQYSNAAAQLLGLILERVYGMPYENLVKTRIAKPLKMKNTKVTLTRPEEAHFKGYDETGVVVSKHTQELPAGAALKSSVEDMVKYAAWHLAEHNEASIMTHKPMWKLDKTYSLGLNWQIFERPGYRYIWQEGSVPGFSSYCLICPELNLGVVVLANELDQSSSSRISAMVKQIVKEIDPRAVDLP